MDDEANIRITLIVVVGVIVFACAIVFGLGVARDGVPIATAQGQTQIVKAGLAACKSLPTAQRATCVDGVARGVVSAPVTQAALGDCEQLSGEEEEQCITEVNSGNDDGSSASEAVASAVVQCNRINGDAAIDRCVSAAMGKPVVAASTKKKKK